MTKTLFTLPYLKKLLTQLTELGSYHADRFLHLEIANANLKFRVFQIFNKGEEIRFCYKLVPSHFFLQYRSEVEGKLYLFYLCLAFPSLGCSHKLHFYLHIFVKFSLQRHE